EDRGLVVPAGQEAAAVGREGDAPDHPLVALQAMQLLAGLDVPEADGRARSNLLAADAVAGSREAAVGREGHAVDPPIVPVEAADQRARLEVPESDRLVLAAGEGAAAVGREGNR